MAMGKVLVADDDKNICELLRLYLVKEGFQVVLAGDGEEALARFSAENPDIILLDVMMPRLDGWQVCREVRKKSSVPIIMITAKGDTFDKVLGLELGADDYIVKPFEVITLLVRIEKILERTGRLNKIYRYDDITVDTGNRIITKCGKTVDLMPMEFDVFAILIKNKNRTVTREYLLNEIWGAEYFGDTRTVDVRVANIRKKLGLTDEIRTISKSGYRLEEHKK